MKYKVDLIDVKQSAKCNGRLYLFNKQKGQWLAAVGLTSIDEVHAIAQAIINREKQDMLYAEVLVNNLLNEMRIEKASMDVNSKTE